MTELSFLIELLLNHDLPKVTKDLLANRIKEVEEKLSMQNVTRVTTPPSFTLTNHELVPNTSSLYGRPPNTSGLVTQAPSTMKALAKHGMLEDSATIYPDIPVVKAPDPIPVEQIAQTPATAAALASRQQAIAEALSGKVDKVAGKPRKW